MRALEKPVCREETRGTFHSTKTFENLANGTEISHKSFQKCRKLLNFRMQTIQPKILEIPGAKLNGQKTSGKKFGYSSRGCPLFWKFWNMLFHSPLEVAEKNSNQTFWLNGKRPRLTIVVQKIGLRRLLRLDAIKAKPSFLLLTQKTGLTSPDDLAAVTSKA